MKVFSSFLDFACRSTHFLPGSRAQMTTPYVPAAGHMSLPLGPPELSTGWGLSCIFSQQWTRTLWESNKAHSHTHICVFDSLPVWGREEKVQNLLYKRGNKDRVPSKEPRGQHQVTPLSQWFLSLSTPLAQGCWAHLCEIASCIPLRAFFPDCGFPWPVPPPSMMSGSLISLSQYSRAFKRYSTKQTLPFPSPRTRWHSSPGIVAAAQA